MLGTVKFFNSTKGFGFITPDAGAKDVFVHENALAAAGMRTLSEGRESEAGVAKRSARPRT